MLVWDRAMGSLLLVAIGDALGMPVETYSHEKIMSLFGRLEDFVTPPADHKWYGAYNKYGVEGFQKGRWTDDTQLTLAIMESIIEKGEIDLPLIAKKHYDEMQKCAIGWGKSTKKSVVNMHHGVLLNRCGNPGGAGNGVVMKLTPIMIYLWLQCNCRRYRDFWNHLTSDDEKMLVDLTTMTHQSDMAVAATFAHVAALGYCLVSTPQNFSPSIFRQEVINGARKGYILAMKRNLPKVKENLVTNLKALEDKPWLKDDDMSLVREMFGEGHCFLYYSLPMTYAYFLAGYNSIDSLYEVASAGGDTDTNAAILGAMFGALNGYKSIPKHLKRFHDAFIYQRKCENFFQKIR